MWCEAELGIEISDEVWEDCIDNIHGSSINVRHSLIQFKIIHRLHFSPARTHKIYPNSSPLCGRCSIEEGTLSHQFILCHKLQNFWNQLFDLFGKAYNRDFPPAPLTALFGTVAPGWAQNKYEIKAILLSTLLARKLILQAWKSAKPPTIDMWIKELGSVLHLEKIRYTLAEKEPLFLKIWSPMVNLLNSLRWTNSCMLIYRPLVTVMPIFYYYQLCMIWWSVVLFAWSCALSNLPLFIVFLYFILFLFFVLCFFFWGLLLYCVLEILFLHDVYYLLFWHLNLHYLTANFCIVGKRKIINRCLKKKAQPLNKWTPNLFIIPQTAL